MTHTTEDILDALYRLYEQPMYYEAYRILHDAYLAEDAVHEAFLRLIRNRAKIVDPRSPLVRSYIHKTVKSAALDLYRKQKRQKDHLCTLDATVENTVSSDLSVHDLPLQMISELEPKYASVMRCLFWDGLTVRETAAVLKISEGCVRKRCERARKYLRSSLSITKGEKT